MKGRIVLPGEREHGTNVGYYQHIRAKEVSCRICLHAHNIVSLYHRRRRLCAPGLGWPLEAPRHEPGTPCPPAGR